MSIRLMMVDDHPVVRAGLRALLEADAAVEVVADVGSGDEALQALDRLVTTGEGAPDLVLMDLNSATASAGSRPRGDSARSTRTCRSSP